MKWTARLALVLLSILALGMGGTPPGHPRPPHRERPRTILEFDKMFGVDGAFVGDQNAVDNIPGDELPWEVAFVHGRLDAAGTLLIFVRGLVFKDDPSVPAELRGINDETEFRAAVSCLTDLNGQTTRSNVTTAGFPANAHGDSLIFAHLALPDPCIAPAVFVLAGSEDKWFAVNGFER